MSKKYISREAPIPGKSSAETHPGYWADRIKYENHRREKWMNHYGQFYYQHPSASYCTEELSYPLDTSQPPMTQIDNYLGAGTVPRSQPFDYLDACIAAKKRRDRCVQKDSGNSKSGCAVCNQMVSARNKNVPRDQFTKAYEQFPDGFGKEHEIPTFIPCAVHTPCGSAQIGIMETRALKGTKCCEMCNMCSKICQLKVDTCTDKNCAKHPQDLYCFPITSDGCTDHDRMAFRKDTSIQSGGQRRVQKICGPQESSASQCLPCPVKPRSASVQANISCTPRACCGSSSGGRGQLANRLCRNPTSGTIAPHKDCDATSVPGSSSRKPRDPKPVHSTFSRNAVVPRQGYQQLPSGKIFKRRN